MHTQLRSGVTDQVFTSAHLFSATNCKEQVFFPNDECHWKTPLEIKRECSERSEGTVLSTWCFPFAARYAKPSDATAFRGPVHESNDVQLAKTRHI